MLGRVTAIVLSANMGARLLGAGLGGWMGSVCGVQACLWLALAGFVLQALLISGSAVRTLQRAARRCSLAARGEDPARVQVPPSPHNCRLRVAPMCTGTQPIPFSKTALKDITMQTRREMLAQSSMVAGLLASAGLLPSAAQAAWSQAAFDARPWLKPPRRWAAARRSRAKTSPSRAPTSPKTALSCRWPVPPRCPV